MLYRQTNDEDILAQVGATINETFMVDFSPVLLLIVTWDRVPSPASPGDVRICIIVVKIAINLHDFTL